MLRLHTHTRFCHGYRPCYYTPVYVLRLLRTHTAHGLFTPAAVTRFVTRVAVTVTRYCGWFAFAGWLHTRMPFTVWFTFSRTPAHTGLLPGYAFTTTFYVRYTLPVHAFTTHTLFIYATPHVHTTRRDLPYHARSHTLRCGCVTLRLPFQFCGSRIYYLHRLLRLPVVRYCYRGLHTALCYRFTRTYVCSCLPHVRCAPHGLPLVCGYTCLYRLGYPAHITAVYVHRLPVLTFTCLPVPRTLRARLPAARSGFTLLRFAALVHTTHLWFCLHCVLAVWLFTCGYHVLPVTVYGYGWFFYAVYGCAVTHTARSYHGYVTQLGCYRVGWFVAYTHTTHTAWLFGY